MSTRFSNQRAAFASGWNVEQAAPLKIDAAHRVSTIADHLAKRHGNTYASCRFATSIPSQAHPSGVLQASNVPQMTSVKPINEHVLRTQDSRDAAISVTTKLLKRFSCSSCAKRPFRHDLLIYEGFLLTQAMTLHHNLSKFSSKLSVIHAVEAFHTYRLRQNCVQGMCKPPSPYIEYGS